MGRAGAIGIPWTPGPETQMAGRRSGDSGGIGSLAMGLNALGVLRTERARGPVAGASGSLAAAEGGDDGDLRCVGDVVVES